MRTMLVTMLLLLLAVSALAGPKVLVLGFDGMDPDMLQQYLDEGIMPNFERFIAQGAQFQPLGTVIPPQSPVAWSSFAAGVDLSLAGSARSGIHAEADLHRAAGC